MSDNVRLLGNVPGSAFGMNFKGNHAYVTGSDGITVLDISAPAAPTPVGFLPLPHFENEDVDLCGNTLLVTHDRAEEDLGAILYVVDISTPALPTIVSVLPLGLTGSGRGSGHVANFVTRDCTRVWMDGGNLVEVVDLSDRAAPKSLGKFESAASKSDAFPITHDTELDSKGLLWSVGGGGAAAYKPTANPLAPALVASTHAAGSNPSPAYNDFILHNSERRGDVLLVTEEDYVDTDEVPPGGCRGQGRFETWSLANMTPGGITPLDTWETELNGMFTGGSADSKAPLTVNCSSHWFDDNRGIAAVAWYEQGTRFLDTRDPRNIRQVGYYLPVNGATWAAYWSPTDPTGEIVYTADATRGIDVIRIDGGGRKAPKEVKAPVPDSWFGPAPAAPAAFKASEAFGWACPVPVAEG